MFASNFGGRFVHITASSPCLFAQSLIINFILFSVSSVIVIDPIELSIFFVGIPSRTSKEFLAVSRFSVAINAHNVRIGLAVSVITSVNLPSCDFLANSIGKNGPSENHSLLISRFLGCQINDPQPKHAIFIF